MLQEKKIYVYFDNNVDKRIKVGCLFADFQRGKEKFSFEYDDEFFTSFLFRNFFDYDLQRPLFFYLHYYRNKRKSFFLAT